MSMQERYAGMKKERSEAFKGRTYQYNTASHGTRTIGVLLGLGQNIYFVGWLSDTGARKRLKTARLPALTDPGRLQVLLDAWAEERGLAEGGK